MKLIDLYNAMMDWSFTTKLRIKVYDQRGIRTICWADNRDDYYWNLEVLEINGREILLREAK